MAFTLSIDDDRLLRRFHDDGVEIGVERGIEQGIKKGRSEGETHLLRLQLQQKFGAVSPYMEQRLQSASQPELDRWATRILSATTIDEVMQ